MLITNHSFHFRSTEKTIVCLLDLSNISKCKELHSAFKVGFADTALRLSTDERSDGAPGVNKDPSIILDFIASVYNPIIHVIQSLRCLLC